MPAEHDPSVPQIRGSRGRQDRLQHHILRTGCSGLSDQDLLAGLLGRQVRDAPEVIAERLLRDQDGLPGLAGSDALELVRHGLTPATAARVTALFELGRRVSQARRRDRPSLKTPEEVMSALGTTLISLPHEELWALPLDTRSRLIGEPRVISQGDIDGTDAGPRKFFRLVLAAGATSCIAVHNHPTGDPTPSAADRVVTRRLAQAGRLVDVPLVDHVIIGAGSFVSLRRQDPSLFS